MKTKIFMMLLITILRDFRPFGSGAGPSLVFSALLDSSGAPKVPEASGPLPSVG